MNQVENTNVMRFSQTEAYSPSTPYFGKRLKELKPKVKEAVQDRPQTIFGPLRHWRQPQRDKYGILHCEARVRQENLTAHILHLGGVKKADASDSDYWAFFKFADKSAVHEVRSSEPIIAEKALRALRLYLCKVNGYRVKQTNSCKPEEHCKTLYYIEQKGVLNNNELYEIHERSSQPGVACEICAKEFDKRVRSLQIDPWISAATDEKKKTHWYDGLTALTNTLTGLVNQVEKGDRLFAESSERKIVASHAEVSAKIRRLIYKYREHKINLDEFKKDLETAFKEDCTAEKLVYMGQDNRYAESYKYPTYLFTNILLFNRNDDFQALFQKFS